MAREGVDNRAGTLGNERMRLVMFSAGLMLITGAALAQEGGAPAGPPRGAAAAGAPAAGGNAAANANAIKPGSMERPHGTNGFGAGSAVPGLYRENPGNGFYGAVIGDYGGQM